MNTLLKDVVLIPKLNFNNGEITYLVMYTPFMSYVEGSSLEDTFALWLKAEIKLKEVPFKILKGFLL